MLRFEGLFKKNLSTALLRSTWIGSSQQPPYLGVVEKIGTLFGQPLKMTPYFPAASWRKSLSCFIQEAFYHKRSPPIAAQPKKILRNRDSLHFF
jgi:hypothetical protein